ncbi:hypothetical protein NDU88_001203 [Pleurodeles waltl]|uniref:Uncharacterized protein n=1 Tax=Pleurodeles waltl TaxID=8319 RepID=A0AAV7V773_PLEWA|nr:hypothetical protein NDU88_001203 [Pleurodeles waltl]
MRSGEQVGGQKMTEETKMQNEAVRGAKDAKKGAVERNKQAKEEDTQRKASDKADVIHKERVVNESGYNELLTKNDRRQTQTQVRRARRGQGHTEPEERCLGTY